MQCFSKVSKYLARICFLILILMGLTHYYDWPIQSMRVEDFQTLVIFSYSRLIILILVNPSFVWRGQIGGAAEEACGIMSQPTGGSVFISISMWLNMSTRINSILIWHFKYRRMIINERANTPNSV